MQQNGWHEKKIIIWTESSSVSSAQDAQKISLRDYRVFLGYLGLVGRILCLCLLRFLCWSRPYLSCPCVPIFSLCHSPPPCCPQAIFSLFFCSHPSGSVTVSARRHGPLAVLSLKAPTPSPHVFIFLVLLAGLLLLSCSLVHFG